MTRRTVTTCDLCGKERDDCQQLIVSFNVFLWSGGAEVKHEGDACESCRTLARAAFDEAFGRMSRCLP